MKKLTIIAFIVMVIAGGGVSFPAVGYAGVCTPPFDSIEEAFIRADIVFKGVIQGNSEPAPGHNPLVEASWGIAYRVFKIEETYKAPAIFSGDKIHIILNGGDLSKEALKTGKEFIVYAVNLRKENDTWWATTRPCNRSFYPSLEQRLSNLNTEITGETENRFWRLSFTGELIRALHKKTSEKKSPVVRTQSSLYFKIDTIHEMVVPNSDTPYFHRPDRSQEFTTGFQVGDSVKVSASNCSKDFQIGQPYFLQLKQSPPLLIMPEENGAISGFNLQCHPNSRYNINASEEQLLKRLYEMSKVKGAEQ